MPDQLDWVFYYPHPEFPRDEVVKTANPYSQYLVDYLWTMVKTEDPYLANRIGEERCMFYIVRSSFCTPQAIFFIYML